MYLMALSIEHEMANYPGGPKALAESVRGSIEAMRPLRWPADRLDTLGGYLWYHNVPLLTLFLAVYAAVQGTRAIRGGEDGHSLEEILATGLPRRTVIRDRSLGFCVVLAFIALGVGAGTAAGMASAGESRVVGSLVTMAAVGLCALVAYALGMLVSQLTTSSRAASGIAAVVLVALYVGTNVAGEVGPLGMLRFISPFHYANSSRALVPGFGADVPALVVLAALAAALLAASAWAFDRRDYRSSLWPRTARPTMPRRTLVQRPMLHAVWTSILLRKRFGLLAWSLSAAAYSAMVAALEPSVMKAWNAFESYAELGGGREGIAPEAQYLSLAVELVMPLVAAYVVTQAAGWVADLDDGRSELILATPVSATRLVWERALAATAGAAIVAMAALGGLMIAAAGVGAPLDAAGLARAGAGCALLAAALAGAAALVVALLRTGIATTALATFVAASYVLGLLVSMLEWPEWIGRLSVFTSFGHPYLGAPSPAGVLVLVTFAVAGGVLAAATAERTPKVS